jgi:glycosyltransferase involved in cell wall biosynthesis
MNSKPKIVLVGQIPVDYLQGGSINAHNYRTQQFVNALTRNGIDVIFVAVDRTVEGCLIMESGAPPFELWRVNDREFGWLKLLRRRLSRECVSAMIGFMVDGASVASVLDATLPLWVDLYGDPLLEKAGQDSLLRNEYGTLSLRWRMRGIIRRADRFSVCSNSQRDLLLGALLYQGRIHFADFLVPTVMAVNYWGGRIKDLDRSPEGAGSRERDPFTLLYNGSVNTWTDVKLLSRVLTSVLSRRDNVRFIQFGKNVVDDKHMREFKDSLGRPELRGRVTFMEGVTQDVAEDLYQASHVCICADLDTIETRFGWRTRYIQAVQEGLVVVATLGNDMANQMAVDHIGLFSPLGDSEALARNLLSLVDNYEYWRELSEQGKHYIWQKREDESQLTELLSWSRSPGRRTSRTSTMVRLRNVGSFLRWTLLRRTGK